ncbi:hypothetical protein NEIG_02320 [Nematocida sp. ERTm5]|nr:hypothetical protein NEIG_02320 [Nematocida sp. ERTm5]
MKMSHTVIVIIGIFISTVITEQQREVTIQNITTTTIEKSGPYQVQPEQVQQGQVQGKEVLRCINCGKTPEESGGKCTGGKPHGQGQPVQ